jgi:hypothetical protein
MKYFLLGAFASDCFLYGSRGHSPGRDEPDRIAAAVAGGAGADAAP